MTSDFLFVYGSLLKQSNNIMSSYLSSKSQWFGEGMMKGKLFMVEYYPGAIYEEDSESVVKGDIYQLESHASIFKVLDNYEDYQPENLTESTFIRKVVPIQEGKTSINCWVYLYNQDNSRCTPIPSGDYLQFDMKQY